VPIYALLAASAVSQVGNVLTFVAVPWFVLQTTGSAALTGISGGAIALAGVLAAFFGGPLVDRVGFKPTSILADLASGVTVAAIPLLYHTVGLEFWHLLVLVFLGSLLDAPGTTARQGLLPDLAGRAGMPLERANSAYQAIQRASFLVGPPLAGFLIVVIGASNVLWVDAATFAVSALAIAAAVPSAERRDEPGDREGYLAELLAGLHFIRRDRLIFTIVVAAVVLNFLDSPVFSVVLPVYAERTFGSAVALGTMLAGFGGGSLLGAVFYGAVGHRMPRQATFTVALAVLGLPYWVLTTMPPLPVAVAALAVFGLASGPINPIIFTSLQERTPPAMLGRAIGALYALALAAAPLGTVVAGFALEAAGLGTVLVAVAACYLVTVVALLLNPALREMKKPKAGGEEEE
jgi:MFS family permease